MSTEEKYENLKIYVIGMETTLAERRNRIADLEEQVKKLKSNPKAAAEEKKAYKKGWQDCASHLINITHECARKLGDVRQEALQAYYRGGDKE